MSSLERFEKQFVLVFLFLLARYHSGHVVEGQACECRIKL